MRIGIDARMFGPKVSGIGNYVKHLTEEIFDIDHEHSYVLFLRPQDFSSVKVPENVKKVQTHIHWYTLSEQILFANIIKAQKLDLMHFTNFNVPILYNEDFMVTIHDITPKLFPGHKVRHSPLRKIAYNKVFSHAIKKSKTIITVSEYSKNQILKYFDVDKHKVKVTYLGISKDFQKKQNYGIINQLKKEYGIVHPYIFYTGVLREHKNIPGLLKAFDLLLKKTENKLQLVLGGDQSYPDPEIKETLQKLHLGENLVTTGFIKQNNLSAWYAGAMATIIPSFAEGFGLNALESLACKTPVAASNSTSVPEILQSAGIYFSPNDPEDMANKIYDVVYNQKLRKRILQNSERILGKYSWKKCAEETIKIYQGQ